MGSCRGTGNQQHQEIAWAKRATEGDDERRKHHPPAPVRTLGQETCRRPSS
ncbi:MAG TPA: hypothetical protein VKL40_09250 [Candidatus Angelobacter sp.]|nr:hypothetical protein [Candidatus Angelobacter sp.]